MKQAYLIPKILELEEAGLEAQEIAERFGTTSSRVGQLRSSKERKVRCDRCEKQLTLYQIRCIGGVPFCEPCRAALFTDHEAASAAYPELFGGVE
jgi:hypothetical protein